MSKRDRYHYEAKRALEKDGWTITHDPFRLQISGRNLAIDLGAERLISAEKGHQKIVVEIKSFLGRSDVRDLEEAIGQYVVYGRALRLLGIERELYLAVPTKTFTAIFSDDLGQMFLEDAFVRLIVFDVQQEVITRWIPA